MFTIQSLPTTPTERQWALEAVASIEAVIQPEDAWGLSVINDLLEQQSIHLMLAVSCAAANIVGYCLYQVVFEQAEILRIGTHPNYQRQGIASQLFVQLNDILTVQAVESLLLEVRADNLAAIALYKQQGFKVIHRRSGYYQSAHKTAVDALIMQRIYIE